MTTQHTPGPWTAPSAGIFAATGERVAHIEPLRCPEIKANGGTRNVEMHANALLIAAAPELLAALDAMIGMTSRREIKAGDWDRIQAQARVAVARAGGYQWPPAAEGAR